MAARLMGKRIEIYRAMERRYGVFAIVLLLRLIPNPLYDLVGYLCGMLGVPFRVYLTASMIGGGVLLGVFCFFGELIGV